MFPKQLLLKMRSDASRITIFNRSDEIADLRVAIDAHVYDVDSRELAACFMAEHLYFMIE